LKIGVDLNTFKRSGSSKTLWEEINEILANQVDLVIDGGPVGLEPTTVIDLTGSTAILIRRGKGDVTPFSIEE